MRNYVAIIALCGLSASCGFYDDGIGDPPSASAPQAGISYGVPLNGIKLLDGGRASNAPAPVQATSTHYCPHPVENGSDAQSACFQEARNVCPEGLKPKQVIFDEATFQIRGYGCS